MPDKDMKAYTARLLAVREVIKLLKADEGFSTSVSLGEVAEAADIDYEDIEDLENK